MSYRTNPLVRVVVAAFGGAIVLVSVWVVTSRSRLSGLGFFVSPGGLAGGLVTVAVGLLNHTMRVELYEQGVVVSRRGVAAGDAWEVEEWVSFVEVVDQYMKTLAHHLILHPRRGGQFELEPRIIGREELGRTINRRGRVRALVRRTLQQECAGDLNGGIATFESAATHSPYNDLGDQAREHVGLRRVRIGPDAPREPAGGG